MNIFNMNQLTLNAASTKSLRVAQIYLNYNEQQAENLLKFQTNPSTQINSIVDKIALAVLLEMILYKRS